MSQHQFYHQLDLLKNKFDHMEPELELTLRDPALDVEGYIVVWNTEISAEGDLPLCGKGGTRITPDLSLDEVKMLSHRMALKNAAAGLPLGGAKSGIKADPKNENFEAQYKRFVTLSKPVLHENGGIFGGFGFDIGASPEHAVWACDALQSRRSFTGKTVEMGGTDYDREGIAGLGVAVSARSAVEYNKGELAQTSFAVQGLGAMGAAVVRYFAAYGAKLSSISDPRLDGTWSFGDLCAPETIIQSITDGNFDLTRQLLDEGDFAHVSTDCQDVLYQDVDVLFPCAVQNVITSDNDMRIQAKYIAEGANGPVTDEARTQLFHADVTVLPDFIANSGGIIAAYVELTSKITAEENAKTRGKVLEAKEMTETRIAENTIKMLELADKYDVMPVDAGMFISLSKMFGLDMDDLEQRWAKSA